MGAGMAGLKQVRFSSYLMDIAEAKKKITKRNASSQIEYWAELGMQAEKGLTTNEVEALMNGQAEIMLRPTSAKYVNAASIFGEVEADRKAEALTSKIVTSNEWYDLSSEHPGYLVKTNRNGEKQIGKLENGVFKVKIK
jgi:hypothetical protein